MPREWNIPSVQRLQLRFRNAYIAKSGERVLNAFRIIMNYLRREWGRDGDHRIASSMNVMGAKAVARIVPVVLLGSPRIKR